MLSSDESAGLREILNGLDDEELFSVLDTVTKRMFTTRHRQEAIEKILSCILRPSDLLRRQKITKKILFNYLVRKGITVLAEWGKPALVKKCLDLWGSTESCKESDFADEGFQSNSPEGYQNTSSEGYQNASSERYQNTSSEDHNNSSSALLPITTQMGMEFSKWFFRILNTLDGFGPEHFWPNCNLSAGLYTPLEQKEVTLNGACDVATFLANLIMIDKFFFSANESSDSILIELEQHGLVKIIIRGVLHQQANCVGLFDSAFGLVKNPDFQDTYKIQVMKVKMQVNIGTRGILPVNNHMSICQTA